MNKKLSLALVLGLFTISPALVAQDSTYISNEYSKALALYNQAQKYNDPELTKQALHELLVLNDRDSTVLRALGELYYNNRRFTSSALIGLDFLEKYPGNLIALELTALSYEQLRLLDKAIEYYEPIWEVTENINILYQIAYLEYSLKRFTSAVNRLEIIQSRVRAAEKIQLNTSEGNIQEVYFKAAALNLEALIAIEQGDAEKAKELLNRALEFSPEFEAAKTTLESLNQ